MNDEIKNAFSDVCVSEKLERKILNMTINKKEKFHKKFKLAYVCSIVAICLLTVTIVYAKEIKDFFQNWSTYIDLGDGTKVKISENNIFKDIPATAIKTEESRLMTYQEIEKMLSLPILKFQDANTNEIYYSTLLNSDGTIGEITLWMPYFLKQSEEKYISASVKILNKNADEGYILAFNEGIDATGNKNIKNSYKSRNLNTDIIIYMNDWSEERLTATFVYDDILYTFIGHNISNDEMISMIETLK